MIQKYEIQSPESASLPGHLEQIQNLIQQGNHVEVVFQTLPLPSELPIWASSLESLPREHWFLDEQSGVFFGVLLGKNFSRPRRAVIEIANGCNLKCDFCWTHSPLNKNPESELWLKKTLTVDAIYDYVDELQRMGTVRLVELCAVGDPMYHPQIWEIVKYIKDRGFRLRLSTNGSLLSPTKWDELGAKLVEELFMNISAGDAETYAGIHNVSPKIYDQLIRNLTHIAAQRKQLGSSFPEMRWINVMTSKNLRNLSQIIDAARLCEANYLDFRYVWIHKDFQKDIRFTEEDIAWLQNSKNDLIQRINDSGIPNNFQDFLQSVLPEKRSPADQRRSSGANIIGSVAREKVDQPAYRNHSPCTVAYHFTLLDVNRELRYCCRGDKIHDSYQGLKEQWENEKYSHFRQEWTEKFQNGKDLCLGCPHITENQKWGQKIKNYLESKPPVGLTPYKEASQI